MATIAERILEREAPGTPGVTLGGHPVELLAERLATTVRLYPGAARWDYDDGSAIVAAGLTLAVGYSGADCPCVASLGHLPSCPEVAHLELRWGKHLVEIELRSRRVLLSFDGVWAGSGSWSGRHVEDCGANLSPELYDAIDELIEAHYDSADSALATRQLRGSRG